MTGLSPTKANLIAAKRSLELANDGFVLMDKKRNILTRELMSLIDKARDIQERIDTVFNDAYDALMVAAITHGGCEDIAASIVVDDSLSLRYRSVMGVEIPTVISAKTDDSATLPYGLAGTSSAVDDAYIKFGYAKNLIRDLAETENAIFRLAYTIKKSQKRVNALKNVVIPRLEQDITRISDELEEKDREEFVRQKIIKNAQN